MNDIADAIIGISTDDPLRKEKIMDIVKRAIHAEKHFVYFRVQEYSISGATKDLKDFLRDKILTHDRLEDEWGIIYGFALGTHLNFQPTFPDLQSKALYFARRWHEGQTYGKRDRPYHWHLKNVARVVSDFIKPECASYDVLMASAYLHDSMEDCAKTKTEIAGLFNIPIADIVYRVTNEPGENRKARHEATYGKIRGHMGATIIKLADRIANLEASWSDSYYGNDHSKLKMYLKEFDSFRDAIYAESLSWDDSVNAMWERLNGLKNNPYEKQGEK